MTHQEDQPFTIDIPNPNHETATLNALVIDCWDIAQIRLIDLASINIPLLMF